MTCGDSFFLLDNGSAPCPLILLLAALRSNTGDNVGFDCDIEGLTLVLALDVASVSVSVSIKEKEETEEEERCSSFSCIVMLLQRSSTLSLRLLLFYLSSLESRYLFVPSLPSIRQTLVGSGSK